ncbi:MAG: hypothetical protein ACYS30_23475, partial [Planctomycetota bacterium]
DDIIGALFHGWYKNPDTSGWWCNWMEDGRNPPTTWAAYYLPNYSDSSWNPSVHSYDSTDTDVLRWQDHVMAREGICKIFVKSFLFYCFKR